MRIRVLSKEGKILCDHDITGAKWISAGNGFTNLDRIILPILESGYINRIETCDDFGKKILNNHIVTGDIQLESGTYCAFESGSLNVSLSLVEQSKQFDWSGLVDIRKSSDY